MSDRCAKLLSMDLHSATKTPYRPDVLPAGKSIAAMFASGLGGGFVAFVGWWLLKQVELPAFNTSMVTRAVATAGTVLLAVVAIALCTWWLWPSPQSKVQKIISYPVLYMVPPAMVVTTLAIPLSATDFYLEGLQVDQGFRTQFLTRMTDTAALADMNYANMPTYYPALWFWAAGRFANVFGLAGWEVFQPWAIVSIAAASGLLTPLWQRLCGSLPAAVGISIVTTAITLVMSAEEPYAAIIAMGVPAITVMARSALDGGWLSTIGIAIFLGFSAMHYTLFTGAVAISIVILAAVVTFLFMKSWRPILHLAVIGFGSIAIALISWGPYIFDVLSGRPRSGATAMHFLPESGTNLPLPFLAPSVIGVLCLVGLVYLIVKFRQPDVRTMAISLVCFYLWALLSMLATLAGTTLLGFRLEILVTLQLATAGILGMIQIYLSWRAEWTAKVSQVVSVLLVVGLGGAVLQYVQQIPSRLETAIDLAYSETGLDGQRADRYAPDIAKHYPAVHDKLVELGYPANQTIVLSDETRLFSFYPYFGFQAFTSHYANPLGEFDDRNAAIEELAKTSWDTPGEFTEAVDKLRWDPMDAFVFRGKVGEPYKYHLAEDIYPNQPNVRYRAIFFNPDAFGAEWTQKQVGPFVVVARNK